MSHEPLQLLLVEDNAADVELLRENLADVPHAHFELAWCDSLAGCLERLKARRFDALLLDLSVRDSQGLGTLHRVTREAPQLPLVVLTGLDDSEIGLRAVQEGAQDYIVKGRADGNVLWRAVRYAIERKRAEEEIRALNSDLERRVFARTRELALANEQLEAFVYSASHDLRAPLRTVEGFVSILLDDQPLPLDDDQRHLMHRIQSSVTRMDALISALLKLSGVGRSPLAWESVDLAAVARRILRDLGERAPERRVDVRVPERLLTHGDPGLCDLMLQNLLTNAWKFSAKADPAVIELGLDEAGAPAAFFVRDNGAGFDMRFADKLFRPFQRLHGPGEFEGTGIGLATVQRIVHLHSGRIWAHGDPGQGATFYFTLAAGPT